MKINISKKILKWITKGNENIYAFAPEKDFEQILLQRKAYYLSSHSTQGYQNFIEDQITQAIKNQRQWQLAIKTNIFLLMFTKLTLLIFTPFTIIFCMVGLFWSPSLLLGLEWGLFGLLIVLISGGLRTMIKSFSPKEQLINYRQFEEKLVQNRHISCEKIYEKIEQEQPALKTLFQFEGSITELFVVIERLGITDSSRLVDFCFYNVHQANGTPFKYSSLQSTFGQISSKDKTTKGATKKLVAFYEQRIIDTNKEIERLKKLL